MVGALSRRASLRTLAASALLLCSSFVSGADLPKELVGIWATAESQFENDRLIGGTALYLLSSGQMALVGAPLPVGRCPDGRLCTPIIGSAGMVDYDAATSHLTIKLREASKSISVTADYNAHDDILELRTGPELARLVRRSAVIPSQMQAMFDAAAKRSNP